MLNIEALFKISYGLYIVSSGNKNSGNGFISNTVFQITAEPPRIAASCHKDNYTCDFIRQSKSFAVSVLHTESSQDIISSFGYRSGRDNDKLTNRTIKYGETGTPIVVDEIMAWFECRVIDEVDVGTHVIFIADVINSEVIDANKEPITYAHYRSVRKLKSPKNAPTFVEAKKTEPSTNKYKKYRCAACGFVYDEAAGLPDNGIEPGTLFSDLPDDWICPECGSPKEEFFEI